MHDQLEIITNIAYRSWPNPWCHSDNCLQGLLKSWNTSVRTAGLLTYIRTHTLLYTQQEFQLNDHDMRHDHGLPQLCLTYKLHIAILQSQAALITPSPYHSVNPLRLSVYYMYHLPFLHFAHTLYLCVPYDSYPEHGLFRFTTFTNCCLE